jgi:hypothetical protein
LERETHSVSTWCLCFLAANLATPYLCVINKFRVSSLQNGDQIRHLCALPGVELPSRRGFLYSPSSGI